MIHVSQLVKYYNGLKALEDVSFHVREGEIFGLLGPNGAGKTTLVGILTTEIKSTRGTARIKGIDVVNDPLAVKHLIGIIPQHLSLDRKLTARENMLVMARAYGVKNPSRRVEKLLSLVGLADRAEGRIREYSGGMLQKLLVARALIHNPEILFLDEPTLGLDPQARTAIWEEILRLKDEGKTMILTTHYMEEADRLCDRVAIMNQGKIVKEGNPENLKKEGITSSVVTFELKEVSKEVMEEIVKFEEVEKVKVIEKNFVELHVYTHYAKEIIPQIMEIILKKGLKVYGLRSREPTLEDVFINLTGGRLK